jgi:hypothetical protein
MRPLTLSSLAALMVAVLVTSGCATAIRGTTQRVTLVTDPPGASCTLSTQGEEASYSIAATPDTVEVRRSSAPLLVNCAKPGHLDVLEQFPNIGGPASDSEAERMQFVGSGVLTLGVTVGVAATVVSTAVAGIGGGVLLAGAGLVVLPLFVLAAPIVLAVDVATGARHGYPPGIAVLLPPSTFPDAAMRDAYFRRLDEAADAVGNEQRRAMNVDCQWKRFHCTENLRELDDRVAEQHKRIAHLRERTRVAPGVEAVSGPSAKPVLEVAVE